jgi:hypothetical protein|uniref:Uncharacterized protein n=1 Tax=Leptospirillum ferriphilum TaxID=178606 RepID=A0A7C3LWK2_9BACT
MKPKLRLLAALLLLSGVFPAGGPVYLGLVRDDIHAHSDLGDTGLQLITISGFLVLLAGAYLFYLSGKAFNLPGDLETPLSDPKRDRGEGG